MDIRTGENTRESWWVTNNTNDTITIGDLLLLPALKPGKKVDLLHHYTREKVSHSIVLTQLVKSGKISLNKKKLFPNSLPGNVPIADIDAAITPAEENELGGGTGTGIHNDLSGLQGGDVPSDEFYHLNYTEFSDLHTHANKAVLDLFDEDSSGLIWNGEPIQGGSGNTYFPSGW